MGRGYRKALHFASSHIVAGKVPKAGSVLLILLAFVCECWYWKVSFISCLLVLYIFVMWITSAQLCFVASPYHLYWAHGSLPAKPKHLWHMQCAMGERYKTHQYAAYQNTTIPLAQTSLGSFLWYLYSTLVPKQAYVAVFVSWWIFCCTFLAEIIGVPLGRIYRVTFWAWWWAALYGRKPPKGPKAISMTSAVSWTVFFSVSWVLEETKSFPQQLVIQMDYARICNVWLRLFCSCQLSRPSS